MKKSLIAFFMLVILVQAGFCQGQTDSVANSEKKVVVDAVAAALQKQYVFPDTARKMGDLIRKNLKAGKYAVIDDPRAFAMKLSADLLSVSRDQHLGMRFAPEAILERKPGRGQKEGGRGIPEKADPHRQPRLQGGQDPGWQRRLPEVQLLQRRPGGVPGGGRRHGLPG